MKINKKLCDADLHNADLFYADLRGANLLHADLHNADLRYADLRHADLRYADLRHADLCDANLRHANLRGVDIDFSCFPLWCGSFRIIDDGKLAKQLLSHIARLDIRDKNVSKFVDSIPSEFKNEFCERHEVIRVD